MFKRTWLVVVGQIKSHGIVSVPWFHKPLGLIPQRVYIKFGFRKRSPTWLESALQTLVGNEPTRDADMDREIRTCKQLSRNTFAACAHCNKSSPRPSWKTWHIRNRTSQKNSFQHLWEDQLFNQNANFCGKFFIFQMKKQCTILWLWGSPFCLLFSLLSSPTSRSIFPPLEKEWKQQGEKRGKDP